MRPHVLAAAALIILPLAAPAAAQQGEAMRFRGMDVDGDGRITRAEWRGSDRSFRVHDWNGGGVLMGDEVRVGARRSVDELDFDPNTREFYDWTEQRFTALDRNRDGRIIYQRDQNGPGETAPMTAAEAYLTHWILEGNTDPDRNVLWGRRAQLLTPDGQRRPAGFKTGTTNDFRDVSGFGYVPGSLTTGVWMGNNNQEPMSNVLGQGLFSADGPLFLWHDFMQRALNEPWAWNGGQPVAPTTFAPPAEIQMASVCRWTGMAATGGCGRVINMPFLLGTIPPPDNLHSKGCLDLVQYTEQAEPNRPQSWVSAAKQFSDRLVNGDLTPMGAEKSANKDGSIGWQTGEGGLAQANQHMMLMMKGEGM